MRIYSSHIHFERVRQWLSWTSPVIYLLLSFLHDNILFSNDWIFKNFYKICMNFFFFYLEKKVAECHYSALLQHYMHASGINSAHHLRVQSAVEVQARSRGPYRTKPKCCSVETRLKETSAVSASCSVFFSELCSVRMSFQGCLIQMWVAETESWVI